MSALDVVAAAIVRDGRVLAARRSHPPELAGGWEFPGGKVEPDEDGPAALVREIVEELGARIEVGPVLGTVTDGRVRLTLFAATLFAATLFTATPFTATQVDGAGAPDGSPLDGGEPTAQDDHDALRWLAPGELGDVDWLPIDRELLPPVVAHLRAG